VEIDVRGYDTIFETNFRMQRQRTLEMLGNRRSQGELDLLLHRLRTQTEEVFALLSKLHSFSLDMYRSFTLCLQPAVEQSRSRRANSEAGLAQLDALLEDLARERQHLSRRENFALTVISVLKDTMKR
jgi:hypothetical protein